MILIIRMVVPLGGDLALERGGSNGPVYHQALVAILLSGASMWRNTRLHIEELGGGKIRNCPS